MSKKETELERLERLLPYAKGLDRRLAEGESILLNNQLARETLKKLKTDFWFNLIYIVFGFLLGFVPLSMSEDKTTTAITELTKSISEKNAQEIQTQTEFHKMRSEILLLKTELDSLKLTK